MQIKIEFRSYTGKPPIVGDYKSQKAAVVINKSDLEGANLEGAHLWRANLEGADLSNANLKGADLSNANLWRANLWRANLEGAHLWRANLWRANLEGADLSDANLEGANLWTANLKGTNLEGANLKGTNLEGANLREAKNYTNSHLIFFELVRRQKIEDFTQAQWCIIGKISIHLWCWGTLKKQFGKKLLPIFKILADSGFAEYYEYYKKTLKP
jgi:hypothetical protein